MRPHIGFVEFFMSQAIDRVKLYLPDDKIGKIDQAVLENWLTRHGWLTGHMFTLGFFKKERVYTRNTRAITLLGRKGPGWTACVRTALETIAIEHSLTVPQVVEQLTAMKRIVDEYVENEKDKAAKA